MVSGSGRVVAHELPFLASPHDGASDDREASSSIADRRSLEPPNQTSPSINEDADPTPSRARRTAEACPAAVA